MLLIDRCLLCAVAFVVVYGASCLVRCLLFVVVICCLLFIVRCALCVVYCLFRVVCRSLFIVRWLLCVAGYVFFVAG